MEQNETKKNGIAKRAKKFPTKTITISKDSFIIVKHGDLKLSLSVRNSISDIGCPLKYIMIHHDTNFKEITFSDSLKAKIGSTNKDGSIYDITMNQES